MLVTYFVCFAILKALSSLRHLNGKPVDLLLPHRDVQTGKHHLVKTTCRVACALASADYPERLILLNAKGGHETAYPCTGCLVTKEETGNPDFAMRGGLPLRTTEEQERRARLEAVVREGRGGVGDARREATAHSLNLAEGPMALEGLDLGVREPGVSEMHAAIPPDWLHVVYEGIGKSTVTWIVQLADHHGTLAELDRRMAAFPTRHGNADVPFRHFTSGISTIPSLPANEVVPLFIMLSCCVGDGPGVFPEQQERAQVQKILAEFLGMCRTAHCEQLTLGDLTDLEGHSRRLLVLLKKTFKRREGLVFSASEFCFPKFHMLLHFTSLVHEYGSIWIFDTARWETFHQYTKELYRRTSGGDMHCRVIYLPPIFAAHLDVCACTGRKKTTEAEMGAHTRAAAKVQTLVRNSAPLLSKPKAPKKLGLVRGSGYLCCLKSAEPGPESPLTAKVHSLLRNVLAGGRYAGCRKKDLPAVAVYATARHRTGILHADGDYYGGAWFDGLEAEVIGDDGIRIRCYARAEAIFSVTEGDFQSDDPQVLVSWYEGAKKGSADGNVYANPRLGMPHLHDGSRGDCSIIPVKDIMSVRWIVPDFDTDGCWWVVQCDGFSFHQHLDKE